MSYQALDEGETPAAIYFDIAKCFDSLDHQIIINKLANFGFDNYFLLLFSSYLANRTQCVKVNNTISSPTSGDSGGPQGSVFLIIFFLVYVNELPATLCSRSFLFADDTKPLNTLRNACDLQRDVRTVFEWGVSNNISFNMSKLELIVYGYRKTSSNFHLDLDNCQILPSDAVTDLGLNVSCDLNWDGHISLKLNKAMSALYTLKHALPDRPARWVKRNMYNTCVMSVLLYASPCWFASRTNLKQLDRFQRKAVKWITSCSFHDTSYSSALLL